MTTTGKLDIKDYGIALAMLLVLCGLAAAGRTKIMGQDGDDAPKHAVNASYGLISPDKFQPIKAEIVNDEPSTFTIDVESIANLSADEDAPVFAVYVRNDVPGQCADFRKLDLNYKKPTQYERQFDLSKHKDVLQAIETQGCVVMRNIPSKG